MRPFHELFVYGTSVFELALDQPSLAKSFSLKFLVSTSLFFLLFLFANQEEFLVREIVCEIVGTINSFQRDPEREITLVTFLGILASRWFSCGEVPTFFFFFFFFAGFFFFFFFFFFCQTRHSPPGIP